MNIRKIMDAGESETLEFKTSFSKDVLESLCAFANHKGGSILLGVAPGGKIVGVSCGEESLQKWANEIRQNTVPSLVPDISVVRVSGKTVVQMRINEFPVKPVACRDRYYKRIANSNHRLSLTEIANLHLQSLQLSWDAYPDERAAVRDLDPVRIRAFLKKVKAAGRFQWTGAWQSVLEKLGYLQDGRPTHAAMILFGKKEPLYSLHIGRFKTPSTIIDDRMFRGTLFGAVEDAMRFIISHLKVAFEITGALQRREIFEYPVPALRELLLNAVVHRDYTSPVDIQIKIFDNAITFFNPGRLYGDLTVAKLKRDDYQSRTRNKLIAEAFYLTGDIEKYGSGFIRVRREIRDYPTMTFDYEESGDGFLVNVHYATQKISEKHETDEGLNGGLNEGLNEGLNRLLAIIKDNPGKRIPQLAGTLGIPAKTIERWLAELKKQDKIEYRGSKKTGGYYIKEDNNP